MARAYILGHGASIPGSEKTFVPAGRSISFYSNVDENTLRANGLAALNAGDIPPVETFAAESEVDNYRLSRFEDDAIAEHMASESSLTGGKTYYIGLETSFASTPLPSPLALCSTPGACARTKPVHSASCQGLFALVAEEELLSVTCRGKRGQSNQATRRLGATRRDAKGHDTSKDFEAETAAEGNRLLKLSKTDPAAAIAQIESLSEPTRRILFANVYSLELFVEDYYKRGGAAISEAVLEARRALESLGEDSFADHVDRYDAKQKKMVLADAGLKGAYDRSVKSRTRAALRQKHEREQPDSVRNRIDARPKKGNAGAATGINAKATDKDVHRAVNLLELSQKETKDRYRKMAIWRMFEALPGNVKSAAQSIVGK